ncbi:MAG: SDR family oxidoreductase [Acidimicrobiia bacterium]
MDLGISGRRAAVAAASRGLGFAVARALAAEGVAVAMCGRSEATIGAAAREVGSGAVPLVADVGTIRGAEAFVADAERALGGIDILVTNAGGPPPGNFEAVDVSQYAAAIELNCLSTVAMCKATVPAMRSRRWGRVLAITSIAVRQPIPDLILSNTARAGVTAFLKTLATETAADGVTVNSLQPGLHETERVQQLYGGDVDAASRGVPTGHLGRPADFGAVAAFLCSEHAKFVTGTALLVDGGAYAGLL